MQDFIKKALIGTILLLLLVAVFWKTLTATAFWGLALYQTKDHSATRLTPEVALPLRTDTHTASSTMYSSVYIPHHFAQTDVLPASDGIRTVFSDRRSPAYYLIAPMGAYKDGFLAGRAELSTDDLAVFCSELTTILTTDPCESDRTFIATVMETSTHTARLFSSPTHKNTAATFLLLKSVYAPGATSKIVPFRSDQISGYLAYDQLDSIAYFFDTNETGYEIVFVHMDQAEIESVLASITNDG